MERTNKLRTKLFGNYFCCDFIVKSQTCTVATITMITMERMELF